MKKVASEIARVRKVLKLMKEKKEPVVSRRKVDKKPKKLDIEKFLPKDRVKTVSDEIINSRRIKQALDAEYARVQGKSNDKVKEALKKLVTKSSGDIIEEQRALDIIKESKAKADKSSTQQLLEYFESKETPEQLLNRVPEYVDADPAVKKEIKDLIKLGGYRDLPKQKSIVKKFIGGTPAQRMLLITEVAATPTAQDIKKEMIRTKAEEALSARLEKLAKQKIADDAAAEKAKDKAERALEKATEKADRALEKATEKADREAEKLALMAPALLIKQQKADAKAAAILTKASKGKVVTPAEQKILDAKVARDLASQKILDAKAIKDLAAQHEIARLAQVETDRLAEEVRLQAEALAEIQAEKLANIVYEVEKDKGYLSKEGKKMNLTPMNKLNIKGDKATTIGDILAKKQAKIDILRQFNAGKKDNKDAQALRLKERSEALAKFNSGKKANIEAEALKVPKEIAKEEARVIEEVRLTAVAKEEKRKSKEAEKLKKIADELEESIKHEMKKMAKPSYKPGNSNTKTNNQAIRDEAARRFGIEQNEAAAKLAAPVSPVAVAPTGKGFKKLNKDTGKGFTTIQLPYGARMMIERYDNEKRLRKNVR